MELHVIETGNFKLDGGAMFGVVPKSLWQKFYPADDKNLCNWAMRCLLVTDEKRKILIDTGIGNKQDEKFFSHYFLNGEAALYQSLTQVGYSKEDITDVILTHLHFDHCGGAVEWNSDRTKLQPSFPKARYWVSKAQWEWATQPNNREKASFLKENILPLSDSGQLQLLENEGFLFPNVEIRFFNGHTDGQIIPLIHTENKTVVFMADLLPSAAHVPLAWVMSYDTRPLLTLSEKEKFLDEAADNQYFLFLEHDILHQTCTVIRSEKGVRVNTTQTLEEAVKK